MTARERARMRRLETLLVEARDAISGELAAVGNDEIRTNPTLQKRSRLLGRIDRFLAGAKRADTSD